MNRSYHLAAACGASLSVPICGPVLSVTYTNEPAPEVLLMLDSLGSMKDTDLSGGAKTDAAKEALIHILGPIPPNVEVGLRVCDADVDGNGALGSYTGSRLAHPAGAMDETGLTNAINRFQPRGNTSIVCAFKEGVKDLSNSDKYHIILVSDEEKTCSPDPYQEIRELITGGISLQIDIVGFGAGDKACQRLTHMVEADDGSHYDTEDVKFLDPSLQRPGARAACGSTVEDTPVQGTDILAGAPMLAPGQYTGISAAPSRKTEKHYKMKRNQPSFTLRVNVLICTSNTSVFDSLKRGLWI